MEELISLKEEIEYLRHIIGDILCEAGYCSMCNERILHLSQALDKLIIKYIKLERNVISMSSQTRSF